MQRFLYFFLGCVTLMYAQEKTIDSHTLPLKMEFFKPEFKNESILRSLKKIQMIKNKWYKYNRIKLHTNQVYFSHWKAGGESSVSAVADALFRRRFSNEVLFWDNELHIGYGVNFQQGRKLIKTDDQIDFTTSLGYRSQLSNVYYSLKASLNTQISNGYAYPDRENPVSKPFSPGYFFLGLGIDYAPVKSYIKGFFSPISLKSTIVLDQRLADAGSFGVKPAQYNSRGLLIKKGENTHYEIGFQLSANWHQPLWENVEMKHKINLYGDYLRKFGNVDIDWEAYLDMKINTYLQAQIGLHLKYDDDVKFFKIVDNLGTAHQYGARIQLKQILGLGLTYTF